MSKIKVSFADLTCVSLFCPIKDFVIEGVAVWLIVCLSFNEKCNHVCRSDCKQYNGGSRAAVADPVLKPCPSCPHSSTE